METCTMHPVTKSVNLKELFSVRFRNYQPAEIRTIRVNLDMSRGEFGELFFSTPGTIKGWELGRRTPTSSAMRVLGMVEYLSKEYNSNTNNRIRRALK